MEGKGKGSLAHSIGTLMAQRALGTAENQLRDSLRELGDVAGILESVEAEVAAALLKEEERKAI
eukprot:5137974-Heterocapsa_arctica.AAC.1